MNKLTITIAAIFVLGCGPTLKFTSAGAARPPKPPTCAITVFTAPPTVPYEELGTIHIQYDNTGFLDDPEDLAKKIQPEICKAGGDAALAFANSYGTYLKATVLSLTPAKKAAPRPPETSGDDALDDSAAAL